MTSSSVAAHSEPVLFHGPKTVLLIGQLCLSRGRIAGFKIMRFEKARRDEWVATRTLIRPANVIEKGDTRSHVRSRSCVISEIRRSFFRKII